jgi:hypothetical protein
MKGRAEKTYNGKIKLEADEESNPCGLMPRNYPQGKCFNFFSKFGFTRDFC